ncbi:GNAT family N-acetyltransferase [Flavobacteriales bacterium]|nr:GNAT family N-acetyltransferase [Flavobacteriales bacterium]
MINLHPFTNKDFDRLINWINSEEELVQFAGPMFSFPLTKNQLEEYVNKEGILPKIVIDSESGEVIGHCELNFVNEFPRLGKILIGNKSYRGKGLGNDLVELMISEIKKIESSEKVELKVYERNTTAVNLYTKKGFVIQPEHTYDLELPNGEFWTNLYMTKEFNKA